MNALEESNATVVRRYLAAIEAGEAGEALARFFTTDVLQVELPNLLNPRGQQSDLQNILVRSEQGRKILRGQKYEILSLVAQDDRVAVEALWTGLMAVSLGTITAGSELRAHFAVFFRMQDGKIASQRNYDCFEPW